MPCFTVEDRRRQKRNVIAGALDVNYVALSRLTGGAEDAESVSRTWTVPAIFYLGNSSPLSRTSINSLLYRQNGFQSLARSLCSLFPGRPPDPWGPQRHKPRLPCHTPTAQEQVGLPRVQAAEGEMRRDIPCVSTLRATGNSLHPIAPQDHVETGDATPHPTGVLRRWDGSIDAAAVLL